MQGWTLVWIDNNTRTGVWSRFYPEQGVVASISNQDGLFRYQVIDQEGEWLQAGYVHTELLAKVQQTVDREVAEKFEKVA